jgi:polyprenyldihydroxybenzoate methyltransferase/3-demethylubiquinol 3-O-methyltransferase
MRLQISSISNVLNESEGNISFQLFGPVFHMLQRLSFLVPRLWQVQKIAITGARYVSTINADEVSHFESLAATWWDPRGPSRLLHRMNPLRLSFIKSLLPPSEQQVSSRWLQDFSVLDVGCGGGILTESLSRLGAKVDGIDASPRAIEVAKMHLRTDPKMNVDNPPNYICGSVDDHKSVGKYDFVTVMEVLEHVDYPSAFIAEVAGQVKPGGWLVFSTISRTWLAWLGTIVAAENIMRIVPPGTHTWAKYIKEPELREHFTGLRDEDGKPWAAEVRSRGCMYDALRGEWKFIDGVGATAVNYFFAVRRAPS